MPKGENFTLDLKQLMFRINNFVEKEKSGPIIPSFNTANRLEIMLGISRASVFRLRSEMHSSEMKRNQEREENMTQYKSRLRRRTASETSLLPKKSHRKPRYSDDIPTASSPKKKGHSGRRGCGCSYSLLIES
jgi:hypothetical protein